MLLIARADAEAFTSFFPAYCGMSAGENWRAGPDRAI